MSEQHSKRIESEQLSRVDSLLGLLKDVSQQDASPALRERLAMLASQRFKEDAPRPRATGWKELAWLKPAFAGIFLVAAGLAAVLVVNSRQHGGAQIHGTANLSYPATSQHMRSQVTPASQPVHAKHPRLRRARHASAKPASTRELTMRLPYSNGVIETGTYTTIRVSMSQSELLSLGFPINRTVQDRCIVAELTLGDDGLPRAISVPLPLEVMKEKK